MSFIAAANWKMNKGPKETQEFFSEFLKTETPAHVQSIFFVPAVNSQAAQMSLKDSAVTWGAQNVYAAESGAFTGENSPKVMADLGASYVLVGHSERRSLFHESNKDTNNKIKESIKQGLSPVLCIGESLDERKSGETLSVLKKQITEGLQGVTVEKDLHVAYEPVWAIGTGEVATVEQIAEAHVFIRELLNEIFPKKSEEIAILYGGSVKPENAVEIAKVQEVGGFLVGGASLKPETFHGIIKAIG